MKRDKEDTLIRDCKSDLMEWLESSHPNEGVSDDCGRLAIKEVVELKARYPKLKTPKSAESWSSLASRPELS